MKRASTNDLLPELEAEAKVRQRAAGGDRKSSRAKSVEANLPQANGRGPQARDEVAEAKSKRTRAKPDDFADVPLSAARCGWCGGLYPDVYKTYPPEADGSRLQLAECVKCGGLSKLISEPDEGRS
jgi:hypothetical protein